MFPQILLSENRADISSTWVECMVISQVTSERKSVLFEHILRDFFMKVVMENV